jgi:hypothetical protein
MLQPFLGTIHNKLILFPRSQILKITAQHINTQIYIQYLPKSKMRSICTLPSKNIKAHLKFMLSQNSLSCYKQIKAVNIFRMTTGYEDSVSQWEVLKAK